MVFFRYLDSHVAGQEAIGFMTRQQSVEYWGNGDFAPIVDTKVLLNESGNPEANEHRYSHRKISRAGSHGTGFKIRGPLGPLSYSHELLSQEQKQIRIVTLLPGTGLDPLRCSMSTHDFPSGTGKYTCLSYVWGTPDGTYPMHLDSGIIGITENLMAALWHIRRKRNPIRLWIDALCINQKDDEEKGRQVQMMGEVFTHADRLISWLGSAQSDIVQISRDLNRLFQASLDWRTNENTRRRLVTALTNVDWINLRPVLDSAYWSRAWIVQEVAVREEYRALYQLSNNNLDKSRYPRARRQAQWPRIRGYTADYLLYGKCKISLWCILVITVAMYWVNQEPDLIGIRSSLQQSANFNESIFAGLGQFVFACSPSSETLIRLLAACSDESPNFAYAYRVSCQSLGAKINRDRLYSLAGLYKNLGIQVDYEKPDVEVVLDISEKILMSVKMVHEGRLLPVQNHSLRPVFQQEKSADDTLLSWVPYRHLLLFPTVSYNNRFVYLQRHPLKYQRTDTFENTRFIRGPGWGKLYTQCMYRAKVTKLFQKRDNSELRKAMAARFGGNRTDDEVRHILLHYLGHIQPFTRHLHQALADYLDIDRYEDSEVYLEVVNVLWNMQLSRHNLGILSDGNIFVSCSYSQINDEVVLAEGFHHAFVVRNANPQGQVLYVEVALLVGLDQPQVITEWREELVMV